MRTNAPGGLRAAVLVPTVSTTMRRWLPSVATFALSLFVLAVLSLPQRAPARPTPTAIASAQSAHGALPHLPAPVDGNGWLAVAVAEPSHVTVVIPLAVARPSRTPLYIQLRALLL